MKKINLAVDISCLTGNLSGIGKYTNQILLNFSDFKEIELYFYSYSNPSDFVLNKLPPSKKRIMNYSLNNFYRLFWLNFKLPFQLKADKIDIFWAPSPRIPLFFNNKIQLICSVHDFVYKFAPETMKYSSYILDRFYVPRCIKRSQKITCISENTKNELSRLFPNFKDKASVIGIGINKSNHLLKSKFDYKNFILFIGTLEPRKNIVTLIKGYKLLSNTLRKKHKLIIAGFPGWKNIDLPKIVSKYNLEKDVIIIKSVKEKDLNYLYKNATCLVSPSIYEGFGMTLIEAMVWGTPILASNIKASREVIGDKGLFFSCTNHIELKTSLENLLLNQKLQKKLSNLFLKRLHLFNWHIVMNKFINIIKSNIKEKKC